MLFQSLYTPQCGQWIVLSDARFEREVKNTETVLFRRDFEGVCFKNVYISSQILLRFGDLAPRLDPFSTSHPISLLLN